MPLLATCVLIFHLKLISVQRIMQMRAATIICYRIRSTQKNKLVKIQILFTVGSGNQFYADCQ